MNDELIPFHKAVGSRVIIDGAFPDNGEEVEARILEISPSGKRVKIQFRGGTVWERIEDCRIVEVLAAHSAAQTKGGEK